MLKSIILVTSLAAAGVQTGQPTLTGVWSGVLTFKGAEAGEESLHLVLKQDGALLTGTGGPDADRQFKITKASVTTSSGATSVTFDLIIDGVLSSFDLKLVEGALKGAVTSEGEDGHKLVGSVTLKKT